MEPEYTIRPWGGHHCKRCGVWISKDSKCFCNTGVEAEIQKNMENLHQALVDEKAKTAVSEMHEKDERRMWYELGYDQAVEKTKLDIWKWVGENSFVSKNINYPEVEVVDIDELAQFMRGEWKDQESRMGVNLTK